MFVKLKSVLIVWLFFIFVPAYADIVTIFDDFDDWGETADLWGVPVDGSWDHIDLCAPDLGYHGVADTDGTGVLVARQQYFDMANISIEAFMRMDGDETDRKEAAVGFLLISGAVLSGDINEYAIVMQIKYDDAPNTDSTGFLKVWHNVESPVGESHTLMGEVEADISLNMFYKLQVSTDSQGQIDIHLYDTTDLLNPLAGLSDVTHTPFASGMIGIAVGDEATFNDFSFTGNTIGTDFRYAFDYFKAKGGTDGTAVLADEFNDGFEPPQSPAGPETYEFDCAASLPLFAENGGVLNLEKQDGCKSDDKVISTVWLKDTSYFIYPGQGGNIEAKVELPDGIIPGSAIGIVLDSRDTVFALNEFEQLVLFVQSDQNGNFFARFQASLEDVDTTISETDISNLMTGISTLTLRFDISSANSVSASLDFGSDGIDVLPLPGNHTLTFDSSVSSYSGGFGAAFGYTSFCSADLEGKDKDIDGADLAIYVGNLSQVDFEDFVQSFGSTECESPLPPLTVWEGDYWIFNMQDLDNLSGYVAVTGNLHIRFTSDLTNLLGLENLTTIGGDLSIEHNKALTTLSGFDHLASIGGHLIIGGNDVLINLSGLGNISSLNGQLYVWGNSLLSNFSGLDNLTAVGRGLVVIDNPSLINFSGLENLTLIDNFVSIGDNNSLIDFTGLNNLTSIGGSLTISNNKALTTLLGLDNLTSVGKTQSFTVLDIYNNNSLVNLNGLEKVALVNDVQIYNNHSLASISGCMGLTSIPGRLLLNNNAALTSLNGLDNLISVGGRLDIQHCDSLTNLSGLGKLNSTGPTTLYHNDSLTSLSGLDSLTSIESLAISDNFLLSNLVGLENITSLSGYLAIEYNTALTSLDLDSLCSIGGDFSVSGNTSLCVTLVEALQQQAEGCNGIGGSVTITGNLPSHQCL